MKTIFLVLAVVALLGLGVVAAPSAQAGTQATCWTDPEAGPIGTVFTVYCAGFSRDTILNAYYVEPDGAAVVLETGAYKTDENGSVAVSFFTKFDNCCAVAVGNWTVVFEEKGLALAIIAHAEVVFRVTGGTEGVSGATVWADPAKIKKSEVFTIYGSGFAPNEVVTIWWEYPNGDCSSFSSHDLASNNFHPVGYSSVYFDDVKADASGYFATTGDFFYTACEGVYRFVARGITSGRGGETWLALTGNPITLGDAWLDASPDTVAATFDWVYFTGSGFGANSPVTCWLKTPHGQVSPIDQVWAPPIKSDGAGNISFSIYTGSYVIPHPHASEGALGVYTMTCKGESTGVIATADYTVTGGIFDP